MWINKAEYRQIIAQAESLEKQLKRAEKAKIDLSNEQVDNYRNMRNLLTALMFGDVIVKTVEIANESVTVIYPKGWPAPTLTVNKTEKA